MSLAAEATASIAPAREEPALPVAVTAVGIVLLLVALVSWLSVRYLNWAMAPRRFWTRVLFAGVLPCAVLSGLLVGLDVSRGVNIVRALANLAAIPFEGKLLMAGMLSTGIGVAWFTARRRDRREALQAASQVEVFQ